LQAVLTANFPAEEVEEVGEEVVVVVAW